ncbi:MAG: glycosyltransferase family 9 protein [Planctomycetota bacterium]|jgi:ADP-heptose:LPS heptosyltransferase
MRVNDDILDLLREKGAEAARKAQRGVILQPGAIGDCILTLPLAAFMKEILGLGGVDILGHSEYIGILPGRTCIDSISSIDSIDLHRLFVETKTFNLTDRDPLIHTFSAYAWIATFIGEPDSNFEQNLIFTANCSHSAEVITLSLKPPKSFSGHVTDFYIQHFIDHSGLPLQPWQVPHSDCLIKTTEVDITRGKELLKGMGLGYSKKLVVIQPGSGGLHKCWHLDNFLAIAKKLNSDGIEVIFLLGPAELDRFSTELIQKIDGAAKYVRDFSLEQVLELLSHASAFIGNDSGITHLAAGLGIRTLAVFGPTNPAVYKPIGPDVTVFVDDTEFFTKEPSASLQNELLDVLTVE